MNEERLSQNYKAACALMNIALGEGTELERLKAMEAFLDDIRPEEDNEQPKMKQSSIDRENTRLPDGTLPTKF